MRLLKPSGREAEAEAEAEAEVGEIPLHWTRYIHKTRHNRTVQKQREKQGFIDIRVRNHSRGLFSHGMACGCGLGHLHLLFGPLVQGFTIF